MPATHIDFAIVGRSRPGRTDQGSAVAAASYNLRSRLAHAGREYDFRRKAAEHVGGDVLLPHGAPPTLRDPFALWSAAEASERRADAQVARQVLVSLPRGCPAGLRLPLAREIAASWVDDGMGVQLDVHCPAAADGASQPHAHFLLTLRRVTDAGLAPTKERAWNTTFRADGGRAERRRIADVANRFLAAHGVSDRLDPERRSPGDTPPEPSASRHDWQRWQRQGADPDLAPASVARVLRHRQRRGELDRALRDVAAAQAEAEALSRQIAAQGTVVDVATAPIGAAGENVDAQEPRTARSGTPPATRLPPISTAAHVAAETRPALQATTNQEEAMARTPSRRPTSRPAPKARAHEPWMQSEGGLDALSVDHLAAAERSYGRWSKDNPKVAARHDLADYVRYVQEQHARRRREQDQDEQEADARRQQAAAARPDEPAAQTDERVSRHAASVLSGARPSLPTGWDARHDAASGVTHYRTPDGGRVTDHGDRLEPAAGTDPARVLDLAVMKGWPGVKLTGDDDFKLAVARAAAMREPPVVTDYPLPPQAQAEVSRALSERAAARVAPLDPAAVRAAAATDPAAAARVFLDHAEAKARAAVAGRPTGVTDPADLSRPRLADLIDRREEAREQAREAREAAAAHRQEHGWSARLLDPSARRRQAALDDEASRLDRESRRLDRTHDRSERRIEKDAERQATAARRALDDWKWRPDVRRAEGQLRDVAALREAVDGGAPGVADALGRGSVREAVRTATAWRDAAPERQRQEAEDRQRQEQRQREEAEQRQREQEDPRTTAVRLALAAEAEAGTDPDALYAARATTAAIAAGDEATVEAMNADGPGAASEAAEAWRQRQAEDLAARRAAARRPAAPAAAVALTA